MKRGFRGAMAVATLLAGTGCGAGHEEGRAASSSSVPAPAVKWSLATGSTWSGPAPGLDALNVLYLTTTAGTVLEYDTVSGAQTASITVPSSDFAPALTSPGPLGSAVIAPDGTLWLSTNLGLLLHYTPSGTLLASHAIATGSASGDPMIGPDGSVWVASRASDLEVLRPESGQWSTLVPPVVLSQPTEDAATLLAIGPDDTAYVSFSGVDSFVAAFSESGTVRWTLNMTPYQSPLYAALAASGALVLLAGPPAAATPQQLVSVNAQTGSVQWSKILPAASNDLAQSGLVISTGGTIYFSGTTSGANNATSVSEVFAYGADGTFQWVAPAPGLANGLALDADGVVYAANGANVFALNADGSLRWSTSTALTGGVDLAPTIAATGALVVASQAGQVIALTATEPLATGAWSKYGGDAGNRGLPGS